MTEPWMHDNAGSARSEQYTEVLSRIGGLLEGEDDWVAAMATVVCELHHAFGHFHWTGFYRLVRAGELVIGPYQGGHGCLRIPVGRGVCGWVAARRETLNLPDVHDFVDHIACSSTTKSEIVVPVLTPSGRLLAVLDVDSDDPAAFSEVDQVGLEAVCNVLGACFQDTQSL